MPESPSRLYSGATISRSASAPRSSERRLFRTFIAIGLGAAVVAAAWLRLETGGAPVDDVALMLLLALVPAAAVLRRHGPIVVGLAFVVTTFVAASAAFDIPLADARPRNGERDFFGPLFDGIHQGFLDFYDTGLPFDRLEFPLMHSLILLGVFGFVALTAALLAARRPIAASMALLVAAGWPTTLAPGARPLLSGALALAAILAILFLARGPGRATRGLGPAVAVGVVLLGIAVGASTSDAVAKQAFLGWQRWDLYDAPEDPVGVRYVWNSHYQGISFPEKATEVLRIKVSDAKGRKLYWRATTLDEYTGIGWRERLDLRQAKRAEEIDGRELDPLLPEEAKDPDSWVKQDVTVGALADNHLIASAQPVRWRPGTGAPVRAAESGVVLLAQRLRPGQRYTAWSYVPRPRPNQLAKAPTRYQAELDRYLELVPGVQFPGWGAGNRNAQVEEIFAEGSQNFLVVSYRDVYRTAREVVGRAKSPYAAALALEAWFREKGGFRYEEQPTQAFGAEPPLVNFVLRSKEGYCQHFAGAMAVMLRMLGVPARVAAGFTSGKYEAGTGEWVVTDHNAHTWVEVYFPGFGWLPFDPTPGRGELTAPYSSVSAAFAFGALALPSGTLLGSGGVLDAITAEALRSARDRPGLEGASGFAGRDEPGGVRALVGDEGLSLFTLALIVIAVALGALVAVKMLRRQLRFAAREPRAAATACRRDLVGYLVDQGVAVPPSATLADLGALVEREFVVDSAPFVRTVSFARFGPPGASGTALRQARGELRTLRRQMSRELGFARRLRGLLSLRSLTA